MVTDPRMAFSLSGMADPSRPSLPNAPDLMEPGEAQTDLDKIMDLVEMFKSGRPEPISLPRMEPPQTDETPKWLRMGMGATQIFNSLANVYGNTQRTNAGDYNPNIEYRGEPGLARIDAQDQRNRELINESQRYNQQIGMQEEILNSNLLEQYRREAGSTGRALLPTVAASILRDPQQPTRPSLAQEHLDEPGMREFLLGSDYQRAGGSRGAGGGGGTVTAKVQQWGVFTKTPAFQQATPEQQAQMTRHFFGGQTTIDQAINGLMATYRQIPSPEIAEQLLQLIRAAGGGEALTGPGGGNGGGAGGGADAEIDQRLGIR